MRRQAIINILFLFIIFVYQLFNEYTENMVINAEDITVKTDFERLELTINDHIFHIDKAERKPTNTSVSWSVFFYSVLSAYLVFVNLELYKNAVLKIHKQVFLATAIYFIFFGITELFCLLPKLELYQNTVITLNIWLSGTVFTVVLFLVLTYKFHSDDW